jgi:hypothetical protein
MVIHREQFGDFDLHAVFFLKLAADGIGQFFPKFDSPAFGPRCARNTSPRSLNTIAPPPTPI